MTDPRLTAAETLQNILSGQTFLSEVKNAERLRAHKDFAFINMLLLTTLRRLVFLKKTLKNFIKKPLPEKSAFVEYALLTAAAELLFMESPDYAVLNSYVNLIKQKTDKYLANFANAVLRNLCRQKNEILAQNTTEVFPPEFQKILQKGYSKATIAAIEEFTLFEPLLDLTVKQNAPDWAERLGGQLMPNGTVRLENNGKISGLPGFHDGSWWVQDFAAALAVQSLGDIRGLKILDLCAAPGGKTAQLINAGADVTALDISEQRLMTLAENIHRLKLPLPKIVCEDALNYLQKPMSEAYDIILLDAPCSATGTLRRHPELIHLKSRKDISQAALVQQQLLSASAKTLAPGGTLLYAVCSLAPQEGEEQIFNFLSAHPNFRTDPITEQSLNRFSNHSLSEIITPSGWIRTLPFHLKHLGGMDGFFIARLKKEE